MSPITSTANTAVKAARKLVRRPAPDGRSVLVEGPQALREAVGRLQTVFATAAGSARHGELLAAAKAAGARVLDVTDEVLAGLTATVNPQGLVGVAHLPRPGLDVLDAAGLVVVLAQPRDPGNVGTILRTADAAGVDAVVLAGDSVDPRNPKAVRASAGSLFHLPVVAGVDLDEVLDACRQRGLGVLAADAGGDVAYTEVDLTGRWALVFGNEAWGLSPSVRDRCDIVARVPLHEGDRPGYDGQAESLNLAATVAVVTYEAARQRATAATGGGG